MEPQRYGWSLPVGRLFGISIRLHLLFVAYIAVELLKAASLGVFALKIVAMLLGMLFGSVLLHELGHCFVAIRSGGSVDHVLLWPLGGLAHIDIPRTWRAHFWTSFGGPAVNVILAAIAAGVLLWRDHTVNLDPLQSLSLDWPSALFRVNYRLLLFNLLPIFPLDGGGMARAILWRKWGYGQGTLIAVRVARAFSVVLGIYGLWADNMWIVMIALFCYFAAEQERVALEMGTGEDGFMGYDFSNGYTSLEASSPRPARRGSFFKRISRKVSSWRAERRAKREKDEEIEVKSRVDLLLEKIAREGMASLSDQERDFLKDASKYYHF